MSLWVKIDCGFYAHRKTKRLAARLRDAAYWVPPRLWAYAAQYHPDGLLPGYTAEELAAAIDYPGDACAMLEALLAAGFLDSDPLRIHDWEEHNAYHRNYAERAKNAAAARWEKERSKEKEEESTEKRRASIASSMLVACLEHGKPAQNDLNLESDNGLAPKEQLIEEIYNAYPRKVGRPTALVKIRHALTKIDGKRLLEATRAYSEAVKGMDPQFIPHPATWFHQERFNDNPKTWKRDEKQQHDRNNNLNSGTEGAYADCGK